MPLHNDTDLSLAETTETDEPVTEYNSNDEDRLSVELGSTAHDDEDRLSVELGSTAHDDEDRLSVELGSIAHDDEEVKAEHKVTDLVVRVPAAKDNVPVDIKQTFKREDYTGTAMFALIFLWKARKDHNFLLEFFFRIIVDETEVFCTNFKKKTKRETGTAKVADTADLMAHYTDVIKGNLQSLSSRDAKQLYTILQVLDGVLQNELHVESKLVNAIADKATSRELQHIDRAVFEKCLKTAGFDRDYVYDQILNPLTGLVRRISDYATIVCEQIQGKPVYIIKKFLATLIGNRGITPQASKIISEQFSAALTELCFRKIIGGLRLQLCDIFRFYSLHILHKALVGNSKRVSQGMLAEEYHKSVDWLRKIEKRVRISVRSGVSDPIPDKLITEIWNVLFATVRRAKSQAEGQDQVLNQLSSSDEKESTSVLSDEVSVSDKPAVTGSVDEKMGMLIRDGRDPQDELVDEGKLGIKYFLQYVVHTEQLAIEQEKLERGRKQLLQPQTSTSDIVLLDAKVESEVHDGSLTPCGRQHHSAFELAEHEESKRRVVLVQRGFSAPNVLAKGVISKAFHYPGADAENDAEAMSESSSRALTSSRVARPSSRVAANNAILGVNKKLSWYQKLKLKWGQLSWYEKSLIITAFVLGGGLMAVSEVFFPGSFLIKVPLIGQISALFLGGAGATTAATVYTAIRVPLTSIKSTDTPVVQTDETEEDKIASITEQNEDDGDDKGDGASLVSDMNPVEFNPTAIDAKDLVTGEESKDSHLPAGVDETDLVDVDLNNSVSTHASAGHLEHKDTLAPEEDTVVDLIEDGFSSDITEHEAQRQRQAEALNHCSIFSPTAKPTQKSHQLIIDTEDLSGTEGPTGNDFVTDMKESELRSSDESFNSDDDLSSIDSREDRGAEVLSGDTFHDNNHWQHFKAGNGDFNKAGNDSRNMSDFDKLTDNVGLTF